MISPFILVAVSYLIAIILYGLNFSTLFPTMSAQLLVFLLAFCLLCFVGHWLFKRSFLGADFTGPNGEITISVATFRKTVAILYAGLIAEFVYARGIPLIGNAGSYTDFGIPTFHVVLMTTTSFVSLLIAARLCFATTHRLQLWVLYGLTLLPFLLVVNRGLFALSIGSGLFYWLLYKYKTISVKVKLGVLLLGIVGLYAFGLFGNFRTQRDYHQVTTVTDTTVMMRIGGASETFKKAPIPKPFFWSYIYVASPLANLQKTMTNQDPVVTGESVKGFILQAFVWDFISKRFVSEEVPQVSQVSPELNVSSAFSAPYLYLGFPGMVLFAIYLLVLPFIYMILLHLFAREYRYIGLATLCTIYAFMFFIDFLTYTALSLQLIFPFALQGVRVIRDRLALRHRTVNAIGERPEKRNGDE